MKNRVCLSGITPDMWTEEHDDKVTHFMKKSSQFLLIVYINTQTKKLMLNNTFPTSSVKELSYFIKLKNEMVTTENFLSLILFGTLLPDNVSGILKAMSGLYAPMFFKNTSWPSSILILVHVHAHMLEYSVLCFP